MGESDSAATRPSGANDEYKLIPLDLIDDPAAPMRETMDEEAMAELVISIQDVGLQTPIRVFADNGRFQVISGHRRRIACEMAGLSPVPCIVDNTPGVSVLAKMVAENVGRENVNPVEEARFYQRVLHEMCAGDIDALADLVKRRRGLVEERLELLAGDERVLAALEKRSISLAVARELNRIDDPDRRLVYLDAANKSGATARTVMEWRIAANQMAPVGPPPNTDMGEAGQAHKIPPDPTFTCFFCGDNDDPHMIEIIYLHRQCKKFVRKALGLEPPKVDGQ